MTEQQITEDLASARTSLARLHDTASAVTVGSYGEFLRTKGLGWGVKLVPLVADDTGDTWKSVRGVRRLDNAAQLGHVGKGYTVVQNTTVADALSTLMEPFGGMAIAKPVRARAYDHGRLCGLYLELPQELSDLLSVRRDGSARKARLNVTWSHDGSRAVVAQLGIWRQVCENGMVVFDETIKPFRIRHTVGVENLVPKMQRWLGEAGRAVRTIGETTRRLDAISVDATMAALIATEVLAPETGSASSKQTQNKVESVVEMLDRRDGTFVPQGDVTLYTMLEAFAAYDAHRAPTRGATADDRQERREMRAVFKGGVSRRAWEVLTAML